MMTKAIKQYGLWTSPITPRSLAEGIRVTELAWDSDGETLVWLEGRSDRGVIVAKQRGEAPLDLTTELNVRARVGYGGGEFTVHQGVVYFVSQGRIYRQSLHGGPARPITPPFGQPAAPAVSPDGRWILFVHSDGDEDVLAITDTEGKYWPQRLVSGRDFFMQPCWHPGGNRIAWIAWDHPLMPWQGTQLELAELDLGADPLPIVAGSRLIAGGNKVAIFQPEFSPDGRWLAYVSDESGFGNLYLYDLVEEDYRPLTDEKMEISLPAWVQGRRSYGFTHAGEAVLYRASKEGVDRLLRITLDTGETKPVTQLSDYTLFQQPTPSPTEPAIAVICSSATTPTRVITCTLLDKYQPRIHRRQAGETIAAGVLSRPIPVSWSSNDGAEVFGLYYPPTNTDFSGIGLPPAVLMIHGGPSSQYSAGYHPETQFLTSRGYAVLEVNYRGSTGYGKDYLQTLDGNWGILDVEDVIAGADFLVESERAAPDKLVIMGGSAGGYTVLRLLCERPDLFKAAVCRYGVADLFSLAQQTHKFEAHYLDSLLGPLPEKQELYRDRSPVSRVERIKTPIAIFQGEKDKVVPKEQAELIVASLRARGIPHEYHSYADEGHGWRKAETIEAYFDTVERFLKRYVLFA
ncbi:MAG: alpha/beta fold hydrolase [Candidatus Bipolaricaulota bacterium]|nr:alpha/beta fold hydrolase [Candidatus Bipolaricaulota bacterium]